MPYLRLSLMTPKSGQEERVGVILDQLLAFYEGRPGFIAAYRLDADPHVESHRMGRISLWETEGHANQTASDEYDMALQSQLRLLVDEDTHEEHSFTASGAFKHTPAG